MKIEYTCEVCGKRFATPAEARECEKGHEEEKRLEGKRKELENAINEAVNKYIEVYHVFPTVSVEDKNLALLRTNEIFKLL